MSETNPLRLTEIALMLLLGAIWGGSFLFMRMAVPDFGAIPLIQVRVGVAAVFLATIVLFQGNLRQLAEQPFKMMIVGLLNSAIPYTLFAFGTKTLTAGFASILNAMSPFFGAILAVLIYHEKMSAMKWLGMLMGFGGVLVLVIGDGAAADFSLGSNLRGGSILGVVACMSASLMYAIAAHFTKRHLAGTNPMVIATSCQIAATLAMLPITPFYWPTESPDLASWLAALALGVVCTGAALGIYFHLIHKIGATRSISVAYLIPLFGVLWGVLFLDETLQVSVVLGGGLILLGLYLVANSKRYAARKRTGYSSGDGDS